MRKLSVLLTLLLLTGAVFASTTTYSSRASFYAANPGVTIEGWDGLSSGTLITVLNGITYTTNDGTALVTNAFLPLSTPNTLGENVNGFFLASDTMTFTFSSPITAFGISINTFDASTGGYTASDNLGNVIGSFFDPFPGFGTGEFVGYTSTTAFSSVTISAPGGFAYTLDDLAYGGGTSTTPEPSSLLLLGSGAVGLAGMIRRKWMS
jgi:hypothetical protein